MSFEWTDENRADAIKRYQEAEPTAENSMDIVTEIAEDIGASPNGLRMILVKADVYVKKEASAASSSSKATGTRVSKADAQASLKEAIRAQDKEVDDDIIDKLTGKAAVYFTALFN